MSDQEKFLDLKMWINIGMFGIAIIGAIGSYYRTTGEIRLEIQTSRQDFMELMNTNNEKLRSEMRDQYATKESSTFVNAALIEIKSDIKSIKEKIDTIRVVR